MGTSQSRVDGPARGRKRAVTAGFTGAAGRKGAATGSGASHCRFPVISMTSEALGRREADEYARAYRTAVTLAIAAMSALLTALGAANPRKRPSRPRNPIRNPTRNRTRSRNPPSRASRQIRAAPAWRPADLGPSSATGAPIRRRMPGARLLCVAKPDRRRRPPTGRAIRPIFSFTRRPRMCATRSRL